MAMLFFCLSFLLLLTMIIGLIKPAIVIRWNAGKTRKKVMLYYGLSFLVCFILFLAIPMEVKQVVDEKSDKVVKEQNQEERKKEEIRQEETKEISNEGEKEKYQKEFDEYLSENNTKKLDKYIKKYIKDETKIKYAIDELVKTNIIEKEEEIYYNEKCTEEIKLYILKVLNENNKTFVNAEKIIDNYILLNTEDVFAMEYIKMINNYEEEILSEQVTEKLVTEYDKANYERIIAILNKMDPLENSPYKKDEIIQQMNNLKDITNKINQLSSQIKSKSGDIDYERLQNIIYVEGYVNQQIRYGGGVLGDIFESASTEIQYGVTLDRTYESLFDMYLPGEREAVLICDELVFQEKGPFNMHILYTGTGEYERTGMGGGFTVKIPEYRPATQEEVNDLLQYTANAPELETLNQQFDELQMERGETDICLYKLLANIKDNIYENRIKWDEITASSYLNEKVEKHAPSNVDDNNYNTSWIEGKDGYGIGEWIMFKRKSPIQISQINIVNGFNKSESLYKSNSRVKRVKVEFSDGTVMEEDLEDYNYDVIYLDEPIKIDSVKITILDVYKGSKYDDTCLGEVYMFENIDAD